MIKRGEIYFVTLDPAHGREQSGRRPVLVVSDNIINSLPLVITVVAGTDAKNIKKSYLTNVLVKAKESGLSKDTIFMCFQLRSLDSSRFADPVKGNFPPSGFVSEEKMAEVDLALKAVLALK